VLHVIKTKVQGTFVGRYFTAWGLCYCSLNDERYSNHYLEDTSQLVDIGMAVWIKCVTVHIICKILYSRWTLVWQLEWCVLQWTLPVRYFTRWILVWQHEWCALKWTLSVRYFTAGGYWYDSLNDLHYSEHYL